MKKISVSLLFLVLCIITLVGCSTPVQTPQATPTQPAAKTSATSEIKPQYGGTLKVIYRNQIDRVGAPYEVSSYYSFFGLPAMERLIRHDKDLRPIPELAESWDITPDGKSITFHLRKGVKFHDGTDFNAEAVKFDLEQVAKSGATTILKNISSYEVTDPYTIKINFKQYDSNFLVAMAEQPYGMMASPTALKKTTTPETIGKDHMVGTGPFKFVSWQRNGYVRFEKFDGYWQKGKPYLDAIQIDQIADVTTGILAIRSGDADAFNFVGPADAKSLEEQGFELYHSNSIGRLMSVLIPDGANADSPFANKSVRQALEFGIDRKAVTQAFGYGYYWASDQCAHPIDASYTQGLPPRNFDPAKAKQLLASAGYPNGFNTKINMQTVQNDLAVMTASFLKDIGINATLDLADQTRFTSLKTGGWKNSIMIGTHIFSLSGIDSNFGRGVQTYHDVLRPAGWLDKLDAASVEINDNKRIAALQGVVKMIWDDSMMVPLYGVDNYLVQNKKVHNFNWCDGYSMYYNAADGWLSK